MKQSKRRQKVGELENHTTDPVKRKGRQPKSQVKSPQPSAGGLECDGMRGSQAKTPHHFPSEESLKLMRDQKQQINDPARHKIKEINQLEEGGESNQKKRRGRPPKLLVKSPKASVADKVHNEDVVAADEVVVKDCITIESELPTITGAVSTSMRDLLPGKECLNPNGDDKKLLKSPLRQNNKLSSTKKVPSAKKEKLQNEKVVQASSKQLEKHSSKRGRRRSVSVNIEPPIQDSQDASRGKTAEVFETDCMMKGVDLAIDKLPCSVSDDEPLSMWFEGMHFPTAVDGSRVSPGRAVEQCTEASEKQKEIVVQSPADDANGDIMPDEDRSLPFVKTFPLWEMIESMEVFRMMPQKPHFRPLDSCKESSREGLAIGCMVTFSSVVKKISELHFDDPRSVFDDSYETLVNLENHGFDVKMVWDRLTGLLSIKDKQEQLQYQSKELRSQMVEHIHEKTKIDEEIDEIDKKIRELQEKRSSSMSMKKIKDSEIASLQSRVDAINEDIKSIQLDFEGLTAAPW
uniref:Uncharacterized protein n=1 Tax=Davidia involucrata TaxID=16924 RepID=A0A5B7A9N5_DAVIN